MRRLPLTLSLVAASLALGVSTASAADVTVNFARDGGSRTVSLGSVAGSFDVNSEYKLVSASGQTTSKTIQGISVRALLDALDADPTYSAVTVSRPGGGVVRISRAQIEAGGLAPVIYEDGGLATFVRPTYSSGDRNAGDVISASPLVITQIDGTDYGLKAKVSRSTARAGQSLKFSATASGGAGQKLTYTWNFNDGTTGSGKALTHKFKKRGYYRVLVSVRGEGETSSSSTVLRVQIGKPASSTKQREGGGTNDSAGAPISGRADGSGGNGLTAGQAAPATPRAARRKRRSEATPAQAELPTISGQLLSGATQPQQQNDLAARSGQQATSSSPSAGIPDEAAGGLVVLSLLGLGAALELGGLTRRRRPLG
jgi:PKD repeat protein